MSQDKIRTLFLIGCFGLFSNNLEAQNVSVETADEADRERIEETFAWKNSKPTVTDFDWVQLVSGEWLKGEIKSLYSKKLQFDSDKLDLLTLDWEDVKYVETHVPGSANIEGHGTVYGFFVIDQKNIVVTLGDDVQEFQRARLVSFITGGEEESDYWSAKISLGLILRSGNNEQVDYTAQGNIKRQTSFSRFTADYIGNISNTQDVETTNNHRVTASHDLFRSQRFFLRPIFAEYFTDRLSNIDARVTIGTGFGYTIIDTSRTNWNVAGGPAYQSTRFISVQPGENDEETTLALVVSTDYDIELTKTLDFIFSYSTTWGNEASGGYTHHLVTTFESEIIGSLDFDVSFIWDRISNPTVAEDGTIPFKDDYQLILGIGYEY